MMRVKHLCSEHHFTKDDKGRMVPPEEDEAPRATEKHARPNDFLVRGETADTTKVQEENEDEDEEEDDEQDEEEICGSEIPTCAQSSDTERVWHNFSVEMNTLRFTRCGAV